jgi:hypothetical protein
MAAQQRWLLGCRLSIAYESASIAGGTPREHKAIATRARNSASVSRETLRGHKAILDCEAKGESEGLVCTLLKVFRGRAQLEVAQTIGGGAPLKISTDGKVRVYNISPCWSDVSTIYGPNQAVALRLNNTLSITFMEKLAHA